MTAIDICKFVQEGEREVFSTEQWLVALSKDQSTIGRAYVSLKDHRGSLSELEPAQWADYIEVVKKVEKTWSNAFGSAPMNWACMMNFAYQGKIPKPHVHWHARPRNKNKIEFAGMTFEDTKFGYHYDPTNRREISGRQLKLIILQLQAYL